MRIIGSIEHPTLKISIFKNDDRLSVKFESGSYEVTYKFRDDITSEAELRQWADTTLIEQANQQLIHMHRQKLDATKRAFPVTAQDEFETII